MITIPTRDLVGIIGDVLAFAWPDDENPRFNVVKLEWDGDNLHAYATDSYVMAWSRWSSIDVKDPGEDTSPWGGWSDPWSIVLDLADAKKVASIFKLPAKEGGTAVRIHPQKRQVKIVREHSEARAGITLMLDESSSVPMMPPPDAIDRTVREDHHLYFPDLRSKLLQWAEREDVPTTKLMVNPRLLAKFNTARPMGPMKMRISGEDAVLVSIGEWFCGAIQPMRDR